LSKENAGSTLPIVMSSSPCGRYLIVDCRFAPYFFGSRDIAMATNFRVKISKIVQFTFIRNPCIRKRIEILSF